MHRVPVLPVILSGGSGTRLWPLSRAQYPKQFIAGLNGQPASLLANTLTRLAPGDGFSAPLILCNNEHRFLVREAAAAVGVAPAAIVLEPEARNTAPAIAVAALMAAKQNPATILAVMPSDHTIDDDATFRDKVMDAATIANTGRIVLLGIAPRGPETGYGYIRKGKALATCSPTLPGGNRTASAKETAFEVDKFFEKPDFATAQVYVENGHYLWNSGIFVFRADIFLAELARLDKPLLVAAQAAFDMAAEDLGFLRLDRETFAKAPSISIDYAVMEKTDKAVVLPIEIGWTDLGSWNALWDSAPRDQHGNFVQGDAMLEDTTNCYVRSERSLISTIGVKDLVIVETPGAVLIADKSRTQDVTGLVARLKAANRTEHDRHLKSYRPWGFFETLSIGPRFQVKLLHVNPGGTLSMQMHKHRSEHWVVVQGTARVSVDGTEKLVRENESVYITATQWHRLENPAQDPLELIEVQLGTYLAEDDIIRRDDVYNRADLEPR